MPLVIGCSSMWRCAFAPSFGRVTPLLAWVENEFVVLLDEVATREAALTIARRLAETPVSYTHLTLPTILRV